MKPSLGDPPRVETRNGLADGQETASPRVERRNKVFEIPSPTNALRFTLAVIGEVMT